MRVRAESGLVCAGVLLASVVAVSGEDYKVLQRSKLGGEGGWDYLKVDADARRLYITRGTHVMVVNADSLAIEADLPDTPGVHGVAIAGDLRRGFTSNGRENTVTIFELGTLKVIGHVKTGTNPDGILYDPFTHRVFAFNGRSGDATVIDAKGGTAVGTIPIGGKLEFGVSDGAGRIFVNVEDKSELVALDARAMKVTARWPLAPCEDPSGLAMDVTHRRLFSVCGNKLMMVVDAEKGRVVSSLPIGGNPDAAGFDADRQLAFSSNGEGTLTVIHEVSPDKFEVVQNVDTKRSARTMALDTKTHNVFLVAADFGAAPPATPEQPRPRPAMLPDSFTLLVVGR